MKTKNIKFVTLCLLVVTLLYIVTAQQVYQEDTQVDLKVPCFNNGTYCSPTSECNLTIIKSDGTTLVDNNLMTNSISYHNFTLLDNETAVGVYRVGVTCADTNINGYSTFEYTITPTGSATTLSSAVVQGIVLFLMFCVTVFFLMFAFITQNTSVKLFFNIISYITMFLTVGTGYILLQSSEIQSNISGTMKGLVFVVGMVFIVIMYYIFINQTKQVLEMMRTNKGYESDVNDNQHF